MTTIMEQADTQGEVDPFEPIPFDFDSDPNKSDAEKEVARLKSKLNTIKIMQSAYHSRDSQFWGALRNIPRQWRDPDRKGAAPLDADEIQIGQYKYKEADVPRRIAAWAKRAEPMRRTIQASAKALEKQIKKVEKQAAQDVMAKQTAAAGGTSTMGTTAVPAASIPKQILTNPSSQRSAVANPYWTNSAPGGAYAGHPTGYKWSTPIQKLYANIITALKRNGLDLPIAYVGRPNGVSINFIMLSGNKKFVWRKYDMGGGSGQNWVFLNGEKFHTSTFVAMTPAKQDAELKRTGVI